ncbi:MAG: hypothetical protein ACKOQS_23690, partial [Dolichospermum sp.]
MSNQVIHHYNQDHDVSSAREIIPYLLDILKTTPTNVVDVGCGLAQWLRVLKEYGVTEVLG